jgi:hypothetical protein
VRRREILETLSDKPGYRRRHLRSEHDHLVVRIEELKRGVPKLRLLYSLVILEGWCEDFTVAEEPEALSDPGLDVSKTG